MTSSFSLPQKSRPVRLTDRTALNRARARAQGPDHDAYFLHRLARDGIEERLAAVKRPLTDAAVITGHPELWAELRPGASMVTDGEVLALPKARFDLVVHAMALHWADDPVGQIIQCTRALRPDGLFLAVFPGGQSLHELRAALAEAEAQVTGGLSPRVMPMGDLRDMGALLQRAGLALPVADSDRHRVRYRSLRHLMHDLRDMGETNALEARRRRPTRRAVFEDAARKYPNTEPDGSLHATVELITLTGWAPDPDQPQPLRPGSATASHADALGTTETPLPRGPGDLT